jgi:hypothetical protein
MFQYTAFTCASHMLLLPDCGRVAEMPRYIPGNTTLNLPVTNKDETRTRETNSFESSSLTLFRTVFKSN